MPNFMPGAFSFWRHYQSFSAVVGVMILLGAWVGLPAFSQNHYTMTAFLRCTRENTIMKAFYLMKDSQGERSLNRIVAQSVRVVFKDMASMNKSLRNYDALSWMSNSGERVIFINQKHRNAPPEALAAIIAHEAMHDDAFNSLSEEVSSWRFEAMVWQELKRKNQSLAHLPAGVNDLVDRENRLEQEDRNGTLEKFVRANPGYRELPEVSPGYGDVQAAQASQ